MFNFSQTSSSHTFLKNILNFTQTSSLHTLSFSNTPLTSLKALTHIWKHQMSLSNSLRQKKDPFQWACQRLFLVPREWTAGPISVAITVLQLISTGSPGHGCLALWEQRLLELFWKLPTPLTSRHRASEGAWKQDCIHHRGCLCSFHWNKHTFLCTWASWAGTLDYQSLGPKTWWVFTVMDHG